MTPLEIYQLDSQYETNDLGMLEGCYYGHLYEASAYFNADEYHENEDVVIKVIKEFDFDGRRYWRLATVWFQGTPIMIIQNAGREGDDWSKRFVTCSPSVFNDLVSYVNSLAKAEDVEAIPIYDLDWDSKELTSFYGNQLNGVFERYEY